MSAPGESQPVYVEALRRLAAGNADQIAVVSGDRNVTYGDLWTEVAGLSSWLAGQGLAPGDVVGVTIKDEYRHLVTVLAAMHAGLAQVGLATHEPVEHRQALASRVAAVAVLAEEAGRDSLGLPLIVPDFGYRAGAVDPPRSSPPGAALFLTSSGTTGRAKVIPVGQHQLLAQSATFQWPRRRGVFFRRTSIEFNNSRRQRLYVLLTGDRNIFGDPGRVGVRETCARNGVTFLALSVAQVRRLLADGEGPLPGAI